MDFNQLPKEIKVDETFDEFDFWCKLLGTTHQELVIMPEQEIKKRMDKAQSILTEHNKRKQAKVEQQNRLNFLKKLNNTFSELQDKRPPSKQERPKKTKEQLKIKLRKLLRERGGADIVNVLIQAAAELSRPFGDNTCLDGTQG